MPHSTLTGGCCVVGRQRSLRKEWVSVLREAMGGRGRVRFVAFYLPRAVALHLNTFRVGS